VRGGQQATGISATEEEKGEAIVLNIKIK